MANQRVPRVKHRRVFLGLGLAMFGWACPAMGQKTYIPKEQQRALYEAAQLSPTPDVSGVINLYQSILGYKAPKEYVPAFRAVSPAGFIMEFVPYGQDVKGKWSEMLTITAMPAAVAANYPASTGAIIMMEGMRSTCPEAFSGEDLGPVNLEGAEAHRVVFGCLKGANGQSGLGELAIVEVIRRQGDVITVQFARRGKHTKTAPLIDENKRRYLLSLLDGLTLTQNRASMSETRPPQPSN